MRIALIGPTHPLKGGVAQHTTVLANRLAADGHDVQIVSWLHQYPQRLYPGRQTVVEAEFPPFEPTRRDLAWYRPDSWWRTARRLRHCDLVVIAQVTPIQAVPHWLMLETLRRAPARTVLICHNVLPHERGPLDEILVTWLLRAADKVVVHSEAEAAEAARLTARPAVTLPLAPFMPPGFARRTPRPGEHRRLLFFGLVRPYKGLDVLLRALAKGPGDVGLRVAGEFWGGPGPVRELCRELGIESRVELRDGYVEASAVPDLFADVDALVLPYRSATGSQGVWTGFEFGVPVIATRAGHLADGIHEGVDGFTARPGDAASLADALWRFYEPGVPVRLRHNVVPVDPTPYWRRYIEGLIAHP